MPGKDLALVQGKVQGHGSCTVGHLSSSCGHPVCCWAAPKHWHLPHTRLSLLSPLLPSLCPLKFTLGRRVHCGLAMGTEQPCTAGVKAACCHRGFAFSLQVCTPTPSPSTHQGDFTTPKTRLKYFVMARGHILRQSQGQRRLEAAGCKSSVL